MAYVEQRTDSGTEPVSFRTDGQWLADDLSRFLSAMNDAYAPFVVVAVAQDALNETGRRSIEMAHQFGGGEIAVPLPESDVLRYVEFVSEKVFDLWPESRLIIASIEMNSPGGISLAGLGEPIRQLREFIKDLWYRNKQEQQAGELEILRQYLQLERDFGPLPPTVLDRLAPRALRGVETLERLEQEGKLVEIPASVGS